MLQLTHEAAAAIQGLQPRHLPEHRIVRITDQADRQARGRLTFVARARAGDCVGESCGIEVAVSEQLAGRLDDMVLDVREGTAPVFYVRT